MNILKKELYQLIKENENVFDFIQNKAVNGLWFWNLENENKKWINPAFCEALGCEVNCIDTDILQELIYEQDKPILQEIYSSLKENKKNIETEKTIRFYHKNGSIVWFEFDFLEIKDKNQASTYLIISYKDVTQKNVNSLINRYESILDTHTFFILRTDLEGKYSYANQYFCDFFEAGREELLKTHSLDTIMPQDHEICMEVVQKCIATPNIPFFVRLRKPRFFFRGDEIVYTDWEFRGITDKKGVISEIQCVGVDVTERVEAEKQKQERENELLHTKKLLQTSNENAKIGIWELDLKTGFGTLDKITREIYEIGENYVLHAEEGMSFYKEKDKEKIKKLVALAIHEGEKYDEQFQFITYKGNKKWIRTTGIPTMKEGKCIALYGTFQDITKQKETEIQLQQKIEELEIIQKQLTHTQKLLETSNEAAQIGTWELNLADFTTKVDKVTKKIHEVDENFLWNVDNAIMFYKEGYSREIITRVFKRAVEEGVSYDEQLKVITAKGNEIWVRTIGIPTFENGKCVELYGTFQNINKQKQNEINLEQKLKELELSQKQLTHTSKLLETCNASAAIGTWEYNVNTKDIKWDEVVQTIYDLPKGIELDTTSKINFFKEGKSRDKVIQIVKEAREEGKPFDEELELINFRGVHKWVRIIGLPQIKEGRCVELYGTFQDITTQKRAELELKQKVEELEKAQQEIQKIQNKLSLTLEKTGIGIWELDLINNKIYWDSQVRKMFGVTEFEEITNEIVSSKIPKESLEVLNQLFEDLITQKKSSYHAQYPVIFTKSSIKHYESKAVLIKNENNNPISVFGITQDITKQKEYKNIIEEKNKELAESEKELKKGIRKMYHLQKDLEKQKQQVEQIFDAVPAMIYQFRRDNEGNVSFPLVSKGSKFILGIDPKTILDNQANEIFEAIHPEDLLGFKSSVKQSAETMQKWESELRLLKDGKEIWVHATSKPTHMDDGGITWTGIMQNIDNLKETEHKVQEQNKQLQETLDELRTTQSQLIHNEKMTTLGQLVASIAHEINTPLGAIRSSAGTVFKMIKSTLSNLPKIINSLSKEQLDEFNQLIEKAAETNALLYSSREKRAIKYKLIADFEERNINDADRIADMLVDMGMHEDKEFYQPFLEIEDAVQIFNSVYEISTILKSNATVRIATEKAAKIIITLKNFSRQDHTGEKQPTNINESLENTLVLYQNKLKYGIQVIREMDTLLPFIHAYEDELAQVWTNLLHNAIQAIDISKTKKGKIYLTTQKQDDKILVSIRDTGKGVPDEVKQKIFDAFFTTKPAGEGSGLGLNIVRKIIDKHEGKIWFETENSGENTGTTFFVELPIK